jgi:hypothetical protein
VFTNGYAVFGGQGNGDVHLNLHGGSGQYRATVYLNNRTPSTGHAAFSMDCNGSNVVPVTDLFTAAGSRGGTVAESCTVAGQEIKVIVRTEAPKTVSAAGFTIQSPCCTKDTMYSYDPSHNLGVNALTVTPLSGSSASVPAPVERGPIVQ